MSEYTPYINFAALLLEDAVKKAKKGNVLDALWLLSDDAKFYIELFDTPREEYVRIAVEGIKKKVKK